MPQVKVMLGAALAALLGCGSLKRSNPRIASAELFPKCLNLGKPPGMPPCELTPGASNRFDEATLVVAEAHHPYHGSRRRISALWSGHSL